MRIPSLFAACCLLIFPATGIVAEDAVDIGSRRELFVDRLLVGEIKGDAKLQLQKPQPREVIFVADQAWEGNTCAYYTMFQDGDIYRMYYRGSHAEGGGGKHSHPDVACYAESKDGIHWTRPNLGLFEFNGSKENNIIWNETGSHNFTPFKDENPDCDPKQRYKAIAHARGGLSAYASADGIHWQLMHDKPVITKGAFDSQNLAFWDAEAKLYRDYHRGYIGDERDILTCTSEDFITWTEPQFLTYPDSPKQQLYTNAIRAYERAPHIYIGFPTRYLAKTQQVEPIFMSSRNGTTFHRWEDPVIPRDAPQDRAGNRSNYMTRALLQLPGQPKELTVYGTEAYYAGPDSRVRRFTYRTDGFVSLNAGADGGELVTKPLKFTGDQLHLNFVTHKGGSVRVELQDADGQPLDGFALADCQPLSGDALDGDVAFAGGKLSTLAGKTVRIRFVVKNADVYSFQFQ